MHHSSTLCLLQTLTFRPATRALLLRLRASSIQWEISAQMPAAHMFVSRKTSQSSKLQAVAVPSRSLTAATSPFRQQLHLRSSRSSLVVFANCTGIRQLKSGCTSLRVKLGPLFSWVVVRRELSTSLLVILQSFPTIAVRNFSRCILVRWLTFSRTLCREYLRDRRPHLDRDL